MKDPASSHSLPALLRRTSLLLMVAAILVGFFGMHVVSGAHGGHGGHVVEGAFSLPSAHVGHTPPGNDGHSHTQHSHNQPATELQTVGTAHADPGDHDCLAGSCSCALTTAVSCTPSLKTGSLSAPVPCSTLALLAPAPQDQTTAPGSWSYIPPGPSPGLLCISRT